MAGGLVPEPNERSLISGEAVSAFSPWSYAIAGMVDDREPAEHVARQSLAGPHPSRAGRA